MLHDFSAMNREELIVRCRAKVGMRAVPPPTPAEIDHGVPVFLDQLVGALKPGATANMKLNTGVGLGLAFCRWAVEANDGQIYARSIPGTGCVFTIDPPRVASRALASL